MLKNAKIQSLYHLPLYLAHLTHAIKSHTTPHTKCTAFMFNDLTHMTSLWLRFSILHPILSVIIRLKSIDLSLITKNHSIPIMDSPILMTLSIFQHVTRIFGCEQQLLLLLKWPKTCFMKCTPCCVGSQYHISSAHSKHSSHLQHYLVHQLW